MKRLLKVLIYVILIVIILIQFYPKPKKNVSHLPQPDDIAMVHLVPPDIHNILTVSCYDCHSNNTRYPWYSKVQPVALWLGNHILDGKKELNFSIFGTYSFRRKYKKLEEIIEQVKADEMPLYSYTIIHRSAILNKAQKIVLSAWANSLRDSIKANYPTDSLVQKK